MSTGKPVSKVPLRVATVVFAVAAFIVVSSWREEAKRRRFEQQRQERLKQMTQPAVDRFLDAAAEKEREALIKGIDAKVERLKAEQKGTPLPQR
jgi:hypothetical protein